MTIPLLELSFEGMFEFGQGYVALSRAVDLEGLTLLDFNPQLIKAHERVKQFYASMGYDNLGGEQVTHLLPSIIYTPSSMYPLYYIPALIYVPTNMYPL